MSEETRKDVITLSHVGMEFHLNKEKVDSLKEYFIKLVKHDIAYTEFWALKDVTFSVKQGDRVGILGLNGAGKSTLMKVIAGVFKPTEGTIEKQGGLAPMIELGAGFDGELTARENIFLNGAVLGYDRDFMKRHFDEIVHFAELENFLDIPIKNFSSGMAARLGFAIATVVNPDILICDEVLSVGDAAFQQKCERRMQEMRSSGTTLLFVSHSIDSVRSVCDHALWLNKGTVMDIGDVDTVSNDYMSFVE